MTDREGRAKMPELLVSKETGEELPIVSKSPSKVIALRRGAEIEISIKAIEAGAYEIVEREQAEPKQKAMKLSIWSSDSEINEQIKAGWLVESMAFLPASPVRQESLLVIFRRSER